MMSGAVEEKCAALWCCVLAKQRERGIGMAVTRMAEELHRCASSRRAMAKPRNGEAPKCCDLQWKGFEPLCSDLQGRSYDLLWHRCAQQWNRCAQQRKVCALR